MVQDLYDLGARKFVVAGMPPTGCLPLQMTAANVFPLFAPHTLQRRCVDQQNADSQAYNQRLQSLIAKSKSSILMKGAEFVYADIYGSLMRILQDPSKEGNDFYF